MRSVNTRRGQLWYTAEAPHPQTNLHGQPLPGDILEAPDAAAASFYISSDGNVMAVDVNISGVFRPEFPSHSLNCRLACASWNVSPDCKQFLMSAPSSTDEPSQPPFNLVVNRPSLLQK